MMRKDRVGVTMIELMVSVLIFAACLLPVFDLIGKSAAIARNTREEILAANLATELLEQIACMPFAQIPVMSQRPLANEENGRLLLEGKWATLLVLSELPRDFERSLTIDIINPYLKKVSAHIAWNKAPRHEVNYHNLVEYSP